MLILTCKLIRIAQSLFLPYVMYIHIHLHVSINDYTHFPFFLLKVLRKWVVTQPSGQYSKESQNKIWQPNVHFLKCRAVQHKLLFRISTNLSSTRNVHSLHLKDFVVFWQQVMVAQWIRHSITVCAWFFTNIWHFDTLG